MAWYANAGLLNRAPDGQFASDSLHRLRLIQFARNRGVTDEQLAAGTASQGDLLGVFEDLTPADDQAYNLIDAAKEFGVDEPLVRQLVELLNWDDVEAGTADDVAALRLLARALALGLPREALLQLVRVFTDVMARLADAEVRVFHDHVHEQFRIHGLFGRELLEATNGVAKPMLELIEPAVRYFHRRAYAAAVREDLLRHLAEVTTPPPSTPGETHAAVMFVDLASFTALTAAMGDQAAAQVLHRLSTIVRGTAADHNGRTIKQIGDAFMLVFAAPRDAIEFGLAVHERVETEPLFPALHIGAHYGTFLYRDGDYVGGTVNTAARVASAGAAGEFLITEELRDAAGEDVHAEFAALPARGLRGIADPPCLVAVRPHSPQRSERATDPVCGMLLDPADVAARVTWHGTDLVFCSSSCAQAFTDNPAHYVGTDGAGARSE